jgi:predicted nucleic acid-binding protein
MAYLVDTNIVVDVTRGNVGAADYLDSLGDAWSISMITCLELLAGSRTQRETTDVDLVLSGYHAIPPNKNIACRAYYLVKTYARSHRVGYAGRADRRHGVRRGTRARHKKPQALLDDRDQLTCVS